MDDFMIRKIKQLVHGAVCRFGVTQSLFYKLSSVFDEEVKAVTAGNRCHAYGSESAVSSSTYRLRRNTHRLEKGLISRPRRDVFGLDYIASTVKAYATLSDEGDSAGIGDGGNEVLQWASDVLDEYFDVVDIEAVDVLKDSFDTYTNAREKCPLPSREFRPFRRNPVDHGISFDQFKKFSDYRRSCRWYLQKKVPRDIIDRAVDVARNSPSACNRQPFAFHVFDEPSVAQEVGAIPMGTRGFSQNFPCFIAIVGDLAAFPFPRDRHVIYVDASLAAMSFQYALELQGIGSCCINWPEIKDRDIKMSKRLALPAHQRVVMCMSIGYPDPDGSVPYSQKKLVDELRVYRS